MKFLLNFTVISILSKIFVKIGISLLIALIALSALPLLLIGYQHISEYDQAVWFYSEVIGLIAAPVIVLTLVAVAQYYAVIFIRRSVASEVGGAIAKMKFWKRDDGKASKSKNSRRVKSSKSRRPKSPDVEDPKPGEVEKEANEQQDSNKPSRIRVPKFKLPKVKVLNVRMPKIKAPNVRVPKIKVPFKKSGLGGYQDENARK